MNYSVFNKKGATRSSLYLLIDSETSYKLKKYIVLYSSDSTLRSLFSLVAGVLFGDISLPEKVQRGLKKYRELIYWICDPAVTVEEKRQGLARVKPLTVFAKVLEEAEEALNPSLPDYVWSQPEKSSRETSPQPSNSNHL